jgi:hypothetical protein
MKAKPAAVLQALMEDLWSNAHGKKPHPKASMEGNRRVIRLAAADLRALLAVYRAMRRLRADMLGEFPPGQEYADRALARVERLKGDGK